MKNLFVLALFAFVLSGCSKDEPKVNQIAGTRTTEYKNIAYIPVHDDEELGSAGALFKDIDSWISGNPDKEVVGVTMVNATEEERVGGYSHTSISGALVIFRHK